MRAIDVERISDACTDILDEIESVINENDTNEAYVLRSIAHKVSGIQEYVHAFKDIEEEED